MKIAWRQLKKNKLYSFVNIIGLTAGIASCLLIGIYIVYEFSYDRFHQNANRIVRVTMDYNAGDAATKVALTGTKVGPQFKRTFPEVEEFTRTLKYARVVKYGEHSFDVKKFLYADSAFFKIFSYPLIKGNGVDALNAPDKVVITQPVALKYFGDEDPLGKILRVGTKDFIVSGIAKTPPLNSQIQFDFLASFNALGASKEEKWWEANYVTYLLLRPNVNLAQLQEHVNSYMKKVGTEELKMPASNYLTYQLEPLTSVHLHSSLDGFEPNTSVTNIYILAAVGLLILLIASVNYTNLATAQSASRTGEIGIRKVMGALKTQVFRQFMAESAVTTSIALLLSLALAYFLLPYFNQLSGKLISGSALTRPSTIALLLTIGIVVTLSSGTYPARCCPTCASLLF
jgi:putative ABC transport system permease protein